MRNMVLIAIASMAYLSGSFLSPVAGQPTGGFTNILPDDFRGKIVYDGFTEGTVTIPARGSRRLSIGNVLNQAFNSQIQNVKGSYHIEIEYEGNLIKGSYYVKGDLNGSGTFTGTRNGDTCQTVDVSGERFTSQCTMDYYKSKVNYTDRRGQVYKTYIETNRVSLIDYAERERQRVEAASRAQANAAAEAARIASLPAAGPILTKQFDNYVQIDSRGWAVNRYIAGSIKNVRIVSGAISTKNYVMRGEFDYAGGAKGWVLASIVGGKLNCIEFWDNLIGCRSLRTPDQGQAMRNAFVDAAIGSSGATPPPPPGYDPRDYQRPGGVSSPPPPPPPPVTPIGGAGGLYGCASPPCW